MEIGWPTNVQHVAHVTFDRFHGFLGLPVEFEPEVPRRAPSASASVFGVSTKSMQCSYDPRGNSVPTILLLMQRRLYEQGGLQAEGIFRINAENSQEEHVRDQLNSGIVPDGIDVHCLAGLIKAWFRELPTGVLDSLAPEQVMQCQTEEECAHLVKLLPPTEAALFDWALNLMADVVLAEPHNKMNARNVAMVFAPNMTQMADPLSALMYAVQVMNFLKTLILRTLKERRQEPLLGPLPSSSSSRPDPPDEDGPLLDAGSPDEEAAPSPAFVSVEPNSDGPAGAEKPVSKFSGQFSGGRPCEPPTSSGSSSSGCAGGGSASRRTRVAAQTGKHPRKETKKSGAAAGEKSRGISLVSRINSRMERVETWR
ncbi:unnamed protein product [Spirodela intermedia]|nr:unnamed protein product [Spirodela intermedia]CAA6668490.1 unnamed protein product [Spirodela intermedia]